MTRIFHFAKASPYLFGTAVVVVCGAGAAIYLNTRGPSFTTLVVHPSDFVLQIAVSGKVVAAQSVDLGFNQNGRIASVNARVGDTIAAGAIIASMENGDLRASLLQKQEALKEAQAKLDALRSGTRPEEIAVTQSTVASDEAALVNVIQNAYTQSDDAVHNKFDQFVANPRSTNLQLSFTISDSQLTSNIISERLKVEGLLKTWAVHVAGLSASSDFTAYVSEAQNNLSAVGSLLADASNALNAVVPGGALSQDTINTYKTNIATGRGNINTAATALSSAVSALLTAQNNLKLQEAGSTAEDIAAQAAAVNAASADIVNIQAQLDKTIVVAPFTGIVTKMDAKVGEIVSPQTSEISMISADIFQIETFVPEVNIANVKVGENASVTLDAYGTDASFDAAVLSIDPAETVRDGVSTYKVKLQFKQKDSRIKSGMTASVSIITERTPNALVVPQGAIFEKNGAKFVQVRHKDSVEDIAVQIGDTSSIGNVQIVSGLSDGDEVILNPDILK
jgi:HlyD family secretion protein